MRHLLGAILVYLGSVAPMPSFANAEAYNTRLSDPLSRTGERFAVVVKNYSPQNVRINVNFDPAFFMTHTSFLQGLINVPKQAVAYNVYFKKVLGLPKIEKERGESLENEDGLLVNKDLFEGLSGINLHPDIKFSTDGPGNPVCTNVFPKKDVPVVGTRIPLTYLGVDESHPSASVIYITVASDGSKCLAEYKSPGDLGWLDGGPGEPEPVETVVTVTVEPLSPIVQTIETIKGSALLATGIPGFASAAGLILNYADAAVVFAEKYKAENAAMTAPAA